MPNNCYTLVELLNFVKENEMPCLPSTPPVNDCPSECPLHPSHAECCSGDVGLGHQLHLCRYPTGCGDATYPVGMNLNINSWPHTGKPVYAYRAFDCTDGVSEVGMLAHAGGIRTGFYSGLRYTPGTPVSGLYTRLFDGAGAIVDGTTFVTSTFINGEPYAFQALGDAVVQGDVVLGGDILDPAGNVLVAGAGGGGGGSTPSINPITNVAYASNALTFTYADGITYTTPSLGGDAPDSTIDDQSVVFSAGPVDLGGAFTAYETGYYYEYPLGTAVPSSLMEFLSPSNKARVSVISTNPSLSETLTLWVNGPGGNNNWAVSAGITDGTYYGRGPTSVQLAGSVGGVEYAGYFQGAVHISGPATCTAGGWSDYVFAPEYELPNFGNYMEETLTRGAFPNMPTEEEAAERLDLADFAKQILEKVEMLFLYHAELRTDLATKGVL